MSIGTGRKERSDLHPLGKFGVGERYKLTITMHLGGSTVGSGKQTVEVTRQADGAKKLGERKIIK